MSVSNDDKEFLCNVTIIKALMQFLPLSDKKKVQEWLKKLQEMTGDMSDSNLRNEYTFYLLINAQNGTLSQPFNKFPPPGKLKPLCRVLVYFKFFFNPSFDKEHSSFLYIASESLKHFVPDFLFEEVQKQLKISYCRLNKMLNASNDNYEKPDLKCEPSNFLCEQPRPRKGVMASLAVFSNYEDGST